MVIFHQSQQPLRAHITTGSHVSWQVSSPPQHRKGVAEWETPLSRREEGVKMVCGRERI